MRARVRIENGSVRDISFRGQRIYTPRSPSPGYGDLRRSGRALFGRHRLLRVRRDGGKKMITQRDNLRLRTPRDIDRAFLNVKFFCFTNTIFGQMSDHVMIYILHVYDVRTRNRLYSNR